MGIEDIAGKTALALMPPDRGSKRFRYDATVSGCIMLLIISFATHIVIACNFLAGWGISGFAQQSEVTAQRLELADIRLHQIDSEIRNAKTQVCFAAQARNQAALTSWGTILQSAIGQYMSKSGGRSPYVQTCEELLVGPAPGP